MAVATGATAGTPGSFTGGDDPADKGELDTIGGVGAAWSPGDYVVVGGSNYYWDGAAWAAGKAPAPQQPPAQSTGRLPDNTTGVVPYWGSSASDTQTVIDQGATAAIAKIAADPDADPTT